MDTLLQAIEQRCSRRKYLPTPLAPSAVAALRQHSSTICKEQGSKYI